MQEDVKEFIDKFNIVDNALQMRSLVRWNGRDLRKSCRRDFQTIWIREYVWFCSMSKL